MPEEKQYAYMVKRNEEEAIGIMYSFGAYYIAIIKQSLKNTGPGTGLVAYTLKRYKTLRGAENYLLKDIPRSERTSPAILYGTEAFIKKGSYWKGE